MDLKKIGLFAGGGVVRNGRNQGTEQQGCEKKHTHRPQRLH